MEKKEYLTEENYQKGKKKLQTIALTILVIGVLVGGILIATGLIKQGKVNSQYSDENKTSISQQLESERQKLINKKSELESKGIKYNAFAEYTDGESYDLYVITKSLDPSIDYCARDEYKTNALTSKYCSLKNDLKDLNNDVLKDIDSSSSFGFYAIGIIVIFAGCAFALIVYVMSKGREIESFQTQQSMPVRQEAILKMAPTQGKARAIIAKETAPAYGEIAKEISKGIKEGLKDNDDEKSTL